MSGTLSRLRGEGVLATLIRGASGAFIVLAAGRALMFGMMVFLAQVLGVEHYGTFIFVLSWLNLFVLIAKVGHDDVLVRFIAAYQATEDWPRLRGVLRRANFTALVASLCLAAIAAAAVLVLRGRLAHRTQTTFWVACATLPLLTLASMRMAALRGLKRVVLGQLPEHILRPLLVVLGVCVLAFLLGRDVESTSAMSVHLGAVAVAYAVGAIWLHRSLPDEARRVAPLFEREWFRVAIPLLFVSGAYKIITQTDTIMVGALRSESEAGVYFAANRVSQLMLFGIVAIQSIAAPMVAAYHAKRDTPRVQRTLTLAALGATLFAIPSGLVLVLAGEYVLGLFGADFIHGQRVLSILVAAQLANAITGTTGLVMTMTGHQTVAAAVLAVSAALNVALNALLIPRYGIEGAAIATLATNLIWNGVIVCYAWKRLGLLTLPIPRRARLPKQEH